MNELSEVDRLRVFNQRIQEQYTQLLVELANYTKDVVTLTLQHDRLIKRLTNIIESRNEYENVPEGLTVLIEHLKDAIVNASEEVSTELEDSNIR